MDIVRRQLRINPEPQRGCAGPRMNPRSGTTLKGRFTLGVKAEVPKNPRRALHLSGSEARFGGVG